MSAYVHGGQSQILLSSSTTLYLILEVESYRIWSSCLWLDWLASNQFQGSTPLCLPNPRITDAHHHTHLFRGGGGLRFWTWICRLAWKAFYQMSHLFRPLIMALPHIHVLVSFLISSPHHFLSLAPLSMVPFLPFLAPKSSHFCFHNRHFSLLSFPPSLSLLVRSFIGSHGPLLYWAAQTHISILHTNNPESTINRKRGIFKSDLLCST